MRSSCFLVIFLFAVMLFTKSFACSCKIVALPQNVDDTNQCYAQYQLLGFLNSNPFGKNIKINAQGDQCGSYSFSGNTLLAQNFTLHINCTQKASAGDNTLKLNASINYTGGNQTCNCIGQTSISCPGTNNVWIIILCSVAGGLVVLGVIGFFIWKKYKKTSSEGYAQISK